MCLKREEEIFLRFGIMTFVSHAGGCAKVVFIIIYLAFSRDKGAKWFLLDRGAPISKFGAAAKEHHKNERKTGRKKKYLVLSHDRTGCLTVKTKAN